MDLKELRKIYFECLCWQPDLMIDFLETKRKSMNYSLDLFYKPLLQFHHDNLRNNEKLAKEKNTFIDENGVLHSSTGVIYYNGFYQNIEILKDLKKIISDFLEEKMKADMNPAASSTPPQKNEPKKRPIKKLSDLITHSNSDKIVEGVKIQYKNIKGKRLKLLLLAMQDLQLIPKDRHAKLFHNLCELEFDWDIADYNAMNGYKYNEITDKQELESMVEYIKSLIEVS